MNESHIFTYFLSLLIYGGICWMGGRSWETMGSDEQLWAFIPISLISAAIFAIAAIINLAGVLGKTW
jgi:hypothetical protein